MKADDMFNKGLSFLREDDTLAALACFEKAYEIRKTPETQSYFALCIAVERGQIREAVKLCGHSVDLEPDNPAHYLNLGKIYLHAKRRKDALEALRAGAGKGLTLHENEEIKRLLEHLGERKRPLFPFLSRSHVLNKYLGILLHRLHIR